MRNILATDAEARRGQSVRRSLHILRGRETRVRRAAGGTVPVAAGQPSAVSVWSAGASGCVASASWAGQGGLRRKTRLRQPLRPEAPT